jgi:hydroxymethylglutaryl-CoA reductase
LSERIGELERLGWLTGAEAERLRQGRQVLSPGAADKLVENVVGVFGLPLAIAPNFRVNGRDYLVPMVIEEPSIVAATSNAAKLAREGGGFTARCDESLLTGQVHMIGMADAQAALAALQHARADLQALADAVHPRLRERGGGVRGIEFRLLPAGPQPVIAAHILVDTCDAMGANLVNTICESVAPELADICGGDAVLRILSNLADRSLVTATARYPLAVLAAPGFSPESMRDRIIAASEIAVADPYRAVTHNKGIMNGIDAVAVATGNDWRAIEAGAHAQAAADGSYGPLATWSATPSGDLQGSICVPLKVGIVGGTLAANPAAAMAIRIAGVSSAIELAELMAAVGLAQNFGALQALATVGIQEGHMRLHARSVVTAAGAPDELHEEVVDRLVEGGEIKAWKVREIIAAIEADGHAAAAPTGIAAGKVILLGEHAAVYGRHALALPLPGAVTAAVVPQSGATSVSIPEWGMRRQAVGDAGLFGSSVGLILRELGADDTGFHIEAHSRLPRAMGLGSSAALAVALTRAFAATLGVDVDDERVNAIAFACERLAHGTPSGIDNTIATYARPILFRNDDGLRIEPVELPEPPPLVVAFSSQTGLTREQVAAVRARRERQTRRFDAIFDEIDALSLAGAAALARADHTELGALMNICHGLLNAIEVSTPELERMVVVARTAGASGAKLTGSGGGGSVIALCPGAVAEVTAALEAAGHATLSLADLGTQDID